MWRRLSLTETGGLRPGRRHRPPWERLGISGPLFVIFIIVTGVSMGTFTWLIQQLAHPHTNITSPNNITSHATVRTNTHTLRKRHVLNSDQNCTTNQIRSTTLCIPINTTTTVTVPWGMLESTGQNENRKLWQVQYHWYMTLGGLDKWSWKNLVAETGPDWSSYLTGRNVLLWRKGLTLAKEQNGLKLIIPSGQREGCQYFILAPYMDTECFLSVMKHDNPSANCTLWDVVHPLVTKVTKKPIFSYQVARANFTCVNLTKGLPLLGMVPVGWCRFTYTPNAEFKPVSKADVWWWCGGVRLFDGLPGNATGTCALVSLLLPISVYPTGVQDLVT
ncbi:unnamed protein product, partial [Coregonus sp. 'balchen']